MNSRSINGFFIFLFSLSLFACEKRAETPEEVRTYFINPFPDKEIDLSRKLGESFCLSSNVDTTCFNIIYDDKTFVNYIVDIEDKDTVFEGKVYKDHGLYYFCRNILNDSSYFINAVKIKSGHITGLDMEWVQMGMIEEILDNSKTHPLNLMRDTLKSPLHVLKPDKKILAKFYKSVLDSFLTYRIIYPSEVLKRNGSDQIAIEKDNVSNEKDSSQNIVNQFYPNPVQDILTIETNLNSEYEMNVLDVRGEVQLKDKFNGNKKTVTMNTLPAGIYFVNLYSTKLGKKEAFKIVVE